MRWNHILHLPAGYACDKGFRCCKGVPLVPQSRLFEPGLRAVAYDGRVLKNGKKVVGNFEFSV